MTSALVRDAAVAMPDGRRLAYTEWGLPDGKPVLFFPGSPGSRLWCPHEEATTAAGVRLIILDRPGVGGSDPLDGRTYANWPKDVTALGDALQFSSFAVIGVSDGGPYAAACAALIPELLSGVAIVSSRGLTKYDWAERPDAVEEWSADQRALFELARHDPTAAADLAAEHSADDVTDWADHPDLLHGELEAAEGDRWFFSDPTRVAEFDAQCREATRQGVQGLKWELIDVFQPWGFRLADISIPVSIFHGVQDPWVTLENVEFQVSTIPKSTLTIWPDSGHMGYVKHWDQILDAVA